MSQENQESGKKNKHSHHSSFTYLSLKHSNRREIMQKHWNMNAMYHVGHALMLEHSHTKLTVISMSNSVLNVKQKIFDSVCKRHHCTVACMLIPRWFQGHSKCQCYIWIISHPILPTDRHCACFKFCTVLYFNTDWGQLKEFWVIKWNVMIKIIYIAKVTDQMIIGKKVRIDGTIPSKSINEVPRSFKLNLRSNKWLSLSI